MGKPIFPHHVHCCVGAEVVRCNFHFWDFRHLYSGENRRTARDKLNGNTNTVVCFLIISILKKTFNKKAYSKTYFLVCKLYDINQACPGNARYPSCVVFPSASVSPVAGVPGLGRIRGYRTGYNTYPIASEIIHFCSCWSLNSVLLSKQIQIIAKNILFSSRVDMEKVN